MVLISEELVRKRSEHNECVISTLEELSLHQEDIEKIDHLQNWCRNLKILLLQSNLISKIENLNKMKSLQYLNLALNNIEVVENLEGCESLEKLDLTLNFVGELISVEKLRTNQHLEHLFLSGNPCAEYDGYRDFVIATLPQLQSLDGVVIERSDRIKAFQNYDLVRPAVMADQVAYRKIRATQKKEARMKNTKNQSGDTALTAEEDEKFWKEMSDNTPETRIELSNHSRRAKNRGNEEKPEPQKTMIKLFNKDGKPNNINEAKISFSFEEDEENNSFVLTLMIYKYLDTSLLDVDVQPQYVTVKIKGRVFQITLSEEVLVDKSSAVRSQTTGHLVITMPKMKGEVKPKTLRASLLTFEKDKNLTCSSSKRQFLEIGKDDNDMDFSKIVENHRSKEKQTPSRTKAKEKIPSENFKDDPDVPPLE